MRNNRVLESRPMIRRGLRLTALAEEEAQIAGLNAVLHAGELDQFSLNARMPGQYSLGTQ